MEEGRGANQRHEVMPARGRAIREPSKMLHFTNGLIVFDIFKHGRTRLGTEGGETIVTYAQIASPETRKRSDHSHILHLVCLLGASWGCLGGLLEAWLQGGLLWASWGPPGGLFGPSQKGNEQKMLFEAKGQFVL